MMRAVLIGDDTVLAGLRDVGPQTSRQMKIAVERLTVRLQNLVKSGYLSGQSLHVVTGTLRRSINRKVIAQDDKVLGTVGTNVVYAKVHEYGGTFQIRAHMAQRRSARSLKKFGSGSWTVRAHSARFPERAFMRPALSSMQQEIRDELSAALARAAAAAMKGK